MGHSLIGQTENAIHRAAFASIKRSLSVKGLSITLMTLASWNRRIQSQKGNIMFTIILPPLIVSAICIILSFLKTILHMRWRGRVVELHKPTFICSRIEGLTLAISPTVITLLTLPRSSLSTGEFVECRHPPLMMNL